MEAPHRSLLARLARVRYPLAAVVFGGAVGGIAGGRPRGPSLLPEVSPKSAEFAGEIGRLGLGAFVGFVLLGFVLGFFSEPGLRRRLENGQLAATFFGLFALVFVGGPLALAAALALVSAWAGAGAGAVAGALRGAASAAVIIGLVLLCLQTIGRRLGRLIVNKKREAMTADG